MQLLGSAFASRGVAMKPAHFDYQAPAPFAKQIDLLASNPEAFVIAEETKPDAGSRLPPWRPRACCSICGGSPGSVIAVGDDGFVPEPHPAHMGVTDNQHG